MIVNNNFKSADEALMRAQSQLRAKGAIDYINYNFLRQ